jgi:hypothetical protein
MKETDFISDWRLLHSERAPVAQPAPKQNRNRNQSFPGGREQWINERCPNRVDGILAVLQSIAEDLAKPLLPRRYVGAGLCFPLRTTSCLFLSRSGEYRRIPRSRAAISIQLVLRHLLANCTKLLNSDHLRGVHINVKAVDLPSEFSLRIFELA